MKTLIAALILLAMAAPAKAENPSPPPTMTNASPVKIVVSYNTKCSSTTVGQVQADYTGNTALANTTAGISKITVFALSQGTTVFFSSDSNVTTSSANSTGFAIYPITTSCAACPTWKEFAISTMQKFFGVSGTNLTPVGICLQR